MKNKILFFVCLLLSNYLFSQTSDFRGLSWGVNRAEVKQTEQAKFVLEQDNYLEYKSVLGDYDARLQYHFGIDGKLMGTKYIIQNRFSNPQQHFQEYDFFANLIKEKYGKPTKKSIITSEENPKDKSAYTSLLQEGKFSQETKWEIPNTEIKLVLSGGGDAVILAIEYDSKEFEQLNQKQKRLMVLKDL